VRSRFGRHFGGGAETEHDGRRGLLVSGGESAGSGGFDSIQVKCKPWAENADKFGGEGRVSIHAPHDELGNTTRCLVRGGGANADRVVTLTGASRNVRKNELAEVAGLAAGANSAAVRREAREIGRRRPMVVYPWAKIMGRLPLCRAAAARNTFIFRHRHWRTVWRDRIDLAHSPPGGNPPTEGDSARFSRSARPSAG
jgi:hypothetical protein